MSLILSSALPELLVAADHAPFLRLQLGDLQADSDESQRALQQLKKKCQRLTAELQDTKLHLEGQQVRNHELEKKQRRSVAQPCALRAFESPRACTWPGASHLHGPRRWLACERGALLIPQDSGRVSWEGHPGLQSHVSTQSVLVTCPKPKRTGFSQVGNHWAPAPGGCPHPGPA